jgi:DNA-binding NarL/FixJ family response regulator
MNEDNLNLAIRVLIAEDQTIIREAYLHSLKETPNITVVASVPDGQAAVAEALRLQPDVVLLDIQMPKLNGIEAAKQIRAGLPQVGVVLISNYHDRQYAETFLRDGTAGKAYLLKTNLSEPNELIRAIEVVAEGGALLDPEIQDQLLQLLSAAPNSELTKLTKREMEVLRLMAEGHTNISIARKLSVSERTVETHVNNIFSKLNLTAEATRNPRVMAVLLFLQSV